VVPFKPRFAPQVPPAVQADQCMWALYSAFLLSYLYEFCFLFSYNVLGI
jgi:hypothetical protein